MLKFKFINWSTISVLGNNKIVLKSYIYLIIVPVLARLLSNLKSPFIYDLTNGYIIKIPLELPFNWVIFYFAALFFTIGTIIYSLFAPQIVKEDSSFGDFEAKKKSTIHLKSYLDDLGISDEYIQHKSNINISKIRQENLSSSAPGEILIALSKWWNKDLDSTVSKNVNLYFDYWRTQTEIKYPIQNLFWEIYQYSKYANYSALIPSFISYSIGIVLIGIIFIQSLKDVIIAIMN